jgi:hypothetical protein
MPKRLRSEEGEEGGSGLYSGLIKNHISEREVNAGILQVQAFLQLSYPIPEIFLQDKKFNCGDVMHVTRSVLQNIYNMV